MSDVRTSYGRAIDDYLSVVPTQDKLGDAIGIAGNALGKSEELLGEAWSVKDDPTEIAKVANKIMGKKDGDKTAYTKDNAPSLYGLQNMANQKYEAGQRAFAALQKIKERAQDLMMDIIKSIGR